VVWTMDEQQHERPFTPFRVTFFQDHCFTTYVLIEKDQERSLTSFEMTLGEG